MRFRSDFEVPAATRRRRSTAVVVAAALCALLVAACSSGKTASPSSTSALLAGPATTAAPSGSATRALPPCPPASVVNAALGETTTGPVVTGTSEYKICTYRGGGPVPTKISISVNTPAGFRTDEQNVAKSITLSTVPGLGDANYYHPGVGEVFVLKGTTQVEILAPGTTDAQDDALVNQII